MSDETPVPGELAIGDHLAGYRLDEIIARGGMAVVYRALDERLGRSVALKVLAAPLAHDEAFRRRFIREPRVAAAVDHPNIVPIFDAGEAGGVLFLAMRLARVAVGQRPLGLVIVSRGSRIIVADSDRDNAHGAAAGLAVIDVPRALARRPALAGVLPSGATPRQFALKPGGRTLLVVDTGSGQLQAVQIARLP